MAAHAAPHLLLVEPDPGRARLLSQMLSSLGAVVAHVRDPAQAALLLSQVQPDGVLVGLHPANARAVRSWLAGLDGGAGVTLLYAEHGALLDLVSAPPCAALSALWPLSRSELALLLEALL